MPTDLRAAVLEGIDREIEMVESSPQLSATECAEVTSTTGIYACFTGPGDQDVANYCADARGGWLTALRHLREIVESHNTSDHETCTECSFEPPCPTLLSLAPDYAPQALKEMEADR